MLKKGLRLRKKEDISQVFRRGKLIFFNEIGCRYLFRATREIVPNSNPLRVAFSFSKKHLPLAIQRNRLRRVLSEAIFQLKDEWPENVDIVFFARKKPQNSSATKSLPIIRYFLEQIKENQKRK
jgi:ribonuclease P protein component